MRIAFVIFNQMTALDFVGVYDGLTRLKIMGYVPVLEWEICAFTETVVDSSGLQFTPTEVAAPLGGYDIVIVPGGLGARKLVSDESFMAWIKTAGGCKLKASVCTGSLLLGAAGFLKDRRATTHPTAFDELRPFCKEVLDRRIVDEWEVVTARGVTSAIDLGLYLCEKLAGREVRERISRQMDYLCYPEAIS